MKARRNIHSRPKSIAAKNIKNDRVFHFRGHDEKAKNIKNRRVHDCGRHDPWATVGSQSFPVCWIVSLRIHSNLSFFSEQKIRLNSLKLRFKTLKDRIMVTTTYRYD